MNIEDYELNEILKGQTKPMWEEAIRHNLAPFILKTNIKEGDGKSPEHVKADRVKFRNENTINGVYTSYKYVKHNVAIECGKASNVIVIDVDIKENMKNWKKIIIDGGYNTIEEFNNKHNGPIVLTPSGGYHYYFRWNEEDYEHYNKPLEYTEIDFQIDGKYAVYPGSTYISCRFNSKKQAHKCNPNVIHSDDCEFRGKKYIWLKSINDFKIPDMPEFLRNHFIKPIPIDSPYKKINEYSKLSTEIFDEIIPYLASEATEYDQWKKVIWCLTSLGATIQQCIDFSKLTNRDNFYEKDVIAFCESTDQQYKYSVGSLKQLCIKNGMDKEQYDKIFKNLYRKNNSNLMFKGDIGLGQLFFNNYKKDCKIKISGDRKYKSYIYNQKLRLWEESNNPTICKKINEVLAPLIQNEIQYIKQMIEKSKKEEESRLLDDDEDNKKSIKPKKNKYIKELEEKEANLDKILKKVQNTKPLRDILDQVAVLIQDNDFLEKLNNNEYEFPIANGKKINFKTLEVKDRTIEDLFTFESPCKYLEKDPLTNAIKYFQDLTKVHNSTKIRQDYYEYMLRVLGYCLTTNTSDQSFYICNGVGSNGKSLLMNIMDKILTGKMCKPIDNNVFFTSNATNHTESLQSLQDSRLCFLSEPKRNIPLDDTIVKRLSGGEKITSRGVGGNQTEWIPTFKVFFLCNQVPNFTVDEAINRRIKFLPFQNIFKKDEKIVTDLLDVHIHEIFTLLAKYANKFYTDRNMEMPTCCKEKTTEIISENDVVQSFLTEYEYIELNDTERAKSRDLYNKYVTFCEFNNIKPSDDKTFKQRLIEKNYVHKRYNDGYYYMKIKVLTYDEVQAKKERNKKEEEDILLEEEDQKENIYEEIDKKEEIDIKKCTKLHNCAEDFNLHKNDYSYCSTCNLKINKSVWCMV